MGIFSKILNSIQGATTTPVDPDVPPAPPAGVMSNIGHILAPEAGSFWSSALQNGLVNARPGMDAYQAQLQTNAAKLEQAKQDAAYKAAEAAQRNDSLTKPLVTPTGSVLSHDGTKVLYDKPVTLSDRERLIAQWHDLEAKGLGESPYAKLLEAAILKSDAPAAIEAKAAAAKDVATTRAIVNNKYKKFAPKAGPRSLGTDAPPPPPK